MKKFILSLILIMLLMPSVIASAETTTREIRINLYEDYSDCVINISWENIGKKASVRIENSDKQTVPVTSANTQYGDGSIIVDVGKASSGYWTIYVTGEDLGIINVTGGEKYSKTVEENAIKNFEAEVTDNNIVFNWEIVSATDDIDVSIRYSTSGYSNYSLWYDYSAAKKGSVKVPLDDMYTGLYNFTIEVYDGNKEYFLSIPEPLYIKQNNAPEKLENIKIGSIDGQIYASWDSATDADRYIVTVYDYNTLNYINSYTVYEPHIDLSDISGTEKYKISVAAVSNNIRGEFDVYELIQTSPAGSITFPDYSVSRIGNVTLYVNCGDDVTSGVYVDENLLLEDAEAGEYILNLTEGTHEIVAYLKDSYGNISTFRDAITIDKTPPIIDLISETDIVSSESYIIEGSTEPDAVISINGVEQKTGDGQFSAKVSLENGQNSFVITAYDAAGNSSVKTVTVEKNGGSMMKLYIYVIPAVVFVLLTIWYVYLNIKSKKGGRK